MSRKQLWDLAQTVPHPTVTSLLADIFSVGIEIGKARSRLRLLTSLMESNEDAGTFHDVESVVAPALKYERAAAKREALFNTLAYTLRDLGHDTAFFYNS
jgi:hypothetical protein